MTDLELITQEFKKKFGLELAHPVSFSAYFKDQKEFEWYFKNVLYFTDAVIGPMERKGLSRTDSIADVASGDGQMSLALILLGYNNITMMDLDQTRLERGMALIDHFLPENKVKKIHGSATDLDTAFDVLISYQTIEHLSDEGNYSVAKKHCQVEFLSKINTHIRKMCFFNAPNRNYPIDGHDTGLPFFHYLPIPVKRWLIGNKWVKCSWSGICRPVSVGFLDRHLTRFRSASNYYAFDSMIDYVEHYPTFDYQGYKIPPIDINKLSSKKKLVNSISKMLGGGMQYFLPVLSIIYVARSVK